MKIKAFTAVSLRVFPPALALSVCVALVSLSPVQLFAAGNPDQPERNPPFSTITVISDSLSDTGRTYAALQQQYPPSPPYFPGRVSNGPLWVEQLAPALRLKYQPLDNFSWAGANTGYLNVFEGLPGMLDQTDEFLSTLKKKADKKALYVVWGGANDFIRILDGESPAVVIPEAIVNIGMIVERLHAAGAENIVVIDLPDIGLTPRVKLLGDPAVATALSAWFNELLRQMLDSLDYPVIRVSAFQLLNDMAAHPSAYGFTNVTDPALNAFPADPDDYLFWDDIHPTTRAHGFVADAVFEALAEAGLLKQLLKHP